MQNYFIENLDLDNKHSIVSELSELLFIMIKHCYLKCNQPGCEKWSIIFSNLKNISELKNSDKKSITNKAIFKHMDIMDIITT